MTVVHDIPLALFPLRWPLSRRRRPQAYYLLQLLQGRTDAAALRGGPASLAAAAATEKLRAEGERLQRALSEAEARAEALARWRAEAEARAGLQGQDLLEVSTALAAAEAARDASDAARAQASNFTSTLH